MFELKSGWIREEIEFCLNAVRSSLNYRLFSESVKSDLEQAVQIQKSLLPLKTPNISAYDIAGYSQPAELEGGDLMIIRKISSEGISHNSYFISAGGLAAVIDPRRDCEAYLDLARELGVRISHIVETHRNEDYVIGSLELAARTGAAIYHGHHMDFAYGNKVKEGDTFRLGQIEFRVSETPGHTLESISIVITDLEVAGIPYAVCTGDALFAGDVGRTDFFGTEKRPEVSELLYNSIWQKILPLGDGTITDSGPRDVDGHRDHAAVDGDFGTDRVG